MKNLIQVITIIFIVFTLGACSAKTSQQQTEKIDLDYLADCLSGKNVVMYGKATCSACIDNCVT